MPILAKGGKLDPADVVMAVTQRLILPNTRIGEKSRMYVAASVSRERVIVTASENKLSWLTALDTENDWTTVETLSEPIVSWYAGKWRPRARISERYAHPASYTYLFRLDHSARS